jgi:hypothetical protein
MRLEREPVSRREATPERSMSVEGSFLPSHYACLAG